MNPAHPASVVARRLSAAVALLALTAAASAAEWKPAPTPMSTRWAAEVDPARPRPEYPRPQLVRPDWLSLNGLWEFAFDDKPRPAGTPLPERILVPFPFEAALSGIGRGHEVHPRVQYRRTFEVPAGWFGKRIRLHFGAVDWAAAVRVNGREVGSHRGGYTPFSLDITEALKPAGPQELSVAVHDPDALADGGWQPKGKQLGSKGIWYTRCTGIWQSVWLEPLPERHIAGVRAEADPATGRLTLKVALAGDTAGAQVAAMVSLNGRPVARAQGPASAETVLTAQVEQPQAWTPESPTLYDIALNVVAGGKVADTVRTYTAFRSVGLKDGRITLNGRPYFLRGLLDQGYWPEGVYTAPTDSALEADVRVAKAMGFNLARKHAKIEEARWYWHCDRLGLLVAQDMPSSQSLAAPEARAQYADEWRKAVAAVGNFPCVILWIPFNEDWGKPGEFQDEMVDLTKRLDPTRPVIDASGWTQRDKTDITDVHDYTNDLKRHSGNGPRRPLWVGEYGGIMLPIPGKTWHQGWGYQVVRTADDLLEKYRFLTDQLNEAPGVSGFVYTQLCDVEQELNGLLTYDRCPKAAPERIAEINLRGNATRSAGK